MSSSKAWTESSTSGAKGTATNANSAGAGEGGSDESHMSYADKLRSAGKSTTTTTTTTGTSARSTNVQRPGNIAVPESFCSPAGGNGNGHNGAEEASSPVGGPTSMASFAADEPVKLKRQSSLKPGEIRTPMVTLPDTPGSMWATSETNYWGAGENQASAARTPLTGYGGKTEMWESATASPLQAQHVTSAFSDAGDSTGSPVANTHHTGDGSGATSGATKDFSVVGGTEMPTSGVYSQSNLTNQASVDLYPVDSMAVQPAESHASYREEDVKITPSGNIEITPSMGCFDPEYEKEFGQSRNTLSGRSRSTEGYVATEVKPVARHDVGNVTTSIITAAGLPTNITSLSEYLESGYNDMPGVVRLRFQQQNHPELTHRDVREQQLQAAAMSAAHQPLYGARGLAPAVAGSYVDPYAQQQQQQQMYNGTIPVGLYAQQQQLQQPQMVQGMPPQQMYPPTMPMAPQMVAPGVSPIPAANLSPAPVIKVGVDVAKAQPSGKPKSVSELLSNILHFQANYFPPPAPPCAPIESRRERAELWYHFADKWDITHRLPPPPRTPLPEMEFESKHNLQELTRAPYRGDRWLVRSVHWFEAMQSNFEYPRDNIGVRTSPNLILEECIC